MKRKKVIWLVYDVTRLRFGGEGASSESVGASTPTPPPPPPPPAQSATYEKSPGLNTWVEDGAFKLFQFKWQKSDELCFYRTVYRIAGNI